MKVVQHFICELCGTEYTDQETAAKCEAYHVKPKKIEKATMDKTIWKPLNNEVEKVSNHYPRRLNIEMEDGSVWTYEMMRDYTKKRKKK